MANVYYSDYDLFLTKIEAMYRYKTSNLFQQLQDMKIEVKSNNFEEIFMDIDLDQYPDKICKESLQKLQKDIQELISLAYVLNIKKNSAICNEVEKI